ncbi:MAG: SapC family protein [Niveispirillum sp.]|nr:SapC family protein [Niveispirillum sp.]
MPVFTLDANRHAKVRLRPQADMAHADRQNHARLGLSEVDLAATDYPLFLMKHAQTGRFTLCALFALEGDRSWYMLGGGWQATYLPETLLRHPFFLAPAEDTDAVLGLAVEESSPRLHDRDGDPLFEPNGQPTATAARIADKLSRHRTDLDEAAAFTAALAAEGVIRPLSMRLRFADGRENQVEGLYGIGAEALAGLSDEAVLRLHRAGYLRATHVMMASANQLYRLQQLHNAGASTAMTELAFAIRD